MIPNEVGPTRCDGRRRRRMRRSLFRIVHARGAIPNDDDDEEEEEEDEFIQKCTSARRDS